MDHWQRFGLLRSVVLLPLVTLKFRPSLLAWTWTVFALMEDERRAQNHIRHSRQCLDHNLDRYFAFLRGVYLKTFCQTVTSKILFSYLSPHLKIETGHKDT